MKLDEVLSRLSRIRRSGRAWMARCPSHEDSRNSLKIDEGEDGRILLHCFAACSTMDIVRALGLEMADLFNDATRRRPDTIVPVARRINLRDMAGAVEDHAMALRIRAGRVLGVACSLSIRCWTSKDLDKALGALAQAYADRERAQLLEDVAFDIRRRELKRKQEAYASRT